jgi:hypothetical protein
LLVDAGESDNMLRFLSWRFNLRGDLSRVIRFPTAVITHSDEDHYGGFKYLFDSVQFAFDSVYHNGLVERTGPDLLGKEELHDGVRYQTEVIADFTTLKQLIADPANVGGKHYPQLMKSAIDNGRVTDIRALSAADGFLPGYAPPADLTIEVIGPVRETIGGRPALRRFKNNDGMTKNGHSLVLRLVYKQVKVLLGGDLNIPAEEHLLEHHSGGLDPATTDEAAQAALIAAARPVFECDVAKACHHGSADFTTLFLRVVNPIATVISSGDDESHCHPRPDALGAIGKYGRGERPLIFSTELARSTKEDRKDPRKLRAEIQKLYQERDDARTAEEIEEVQAEIAKAFARMERSVAVYGLINLRTDGQKVLLAQKLERPGSGRREFDVSLLEPDATGALHYVSEH